MLKPGLALLAVVALSSSAAANDTPQALPFMQDWSNTGLIATTDDWSGVPGIVGFLGQGLTSTHAIDPQTVLGESTTMNDVDVIANQTATTSMTGGVAEFQLADSVVAVQGSGTADAPYLLITVDTTNVAIVRVAYNLRDLDASSDDAVQPIALQYRVGTSGDFTNVAAGFVADATTGPLLATAVTAVNAVLPTDAGNQPVVQIRIITANALGNDEWVGIDDIAITNATTNPTAAGTATPASALRGAAVTLAAAVTPGAFPASTGIGVTCDLTAIGGSATQSLFDNAMNGDATAGDNVFAFATTVALASTAGAKSLPCTVADVEARTSNFTIAFTVEAVCNDGIVEGGEGCDDGGTTPGDGCSATCTIEPGYACSGAPSVCTDIDECTTNTDDCSPNATCANTTGSYTCACLSGFEGNGMGQTGCTDIDECTTSADDCVTVATCTNTAGDFTCNCPLGYSGDGTTGGTGCTDIDECAMGSDDCVAEATCMNLTSGPGGMFACACPAGYSGDGRTGGTGCVDTDECGTNADTCDVNATCTNTGGAFSCACNTGYTGDGMTCTAVGGGGGDDEDDGGGCCSSSTDPSGVALLILIVMAGLRRRQRR